MRKVYFATRTRGFFKHLFYEKNIHWNITSNNNTYEINSVSRNILSKFIRSRLLDYLGIIQVKKCKVKNANIYGSFNRFLNVDKPYFIYTENPTALYHYSISRGKSYFGKKNIKKRLQDPNLKSIICMSQACYNTFDELCGTTCKKEFKEVIYPYVPANSCVNIKKIEERCKYKKIELLFIAQGIRFISKGGLEVIEAFKKLKNNNPNINLTIITSKKDLEEKILKDILDIKGIKILEFKFSYDELEKIYSNSSILLHPTSDDSFGLTVLEAMKAGLPIISTKLYAIPEMVEEGINGFLTNPKFWFFDENKLPNPKVWNNRKQTIYSKEISNELVDFIVEKVQLLDSDRNMLLEMSKQSYYISNNKPFSTDYIVQQWNSIIDKY